MSERDFSLSGLFGPEAEEPVWHVTGGPSDRQIRLEMDYKPAYDAPACDPADAHEAENFRIMRDSPYFFVSWNMNDGSYCFQPAIGAQEIHQFCKDNAHVYTPPVPVRVVKIERDITTGICAFITRPTNKLAPVVSQAFVI